MTDLKKTENNKISKNVLLIKKIVYIFFPNSLCDQIFCLQSRQSLFICVVMDQCSEDLINFAFMDLQQMKRFFRLVNINNKCFLFFFIEKTSQ